VVLSKDYFDGERKKFAQMRGDLRDLRSELKPVFARNSRKLDAHTNGPRGKGGAREEENGFTLLGHSYHVNPVQPFGLWHRTPSMRVRLAIERATSDELQEYLRQALHKADAVKLMTPELIATLCDHAQGNLRALMNNGRRAAQSTSVPPQHFAGHREHAEAILARFSHTTE
jgi:hypothetical protein